MLELSRLKLGQIKFAMEVFDLQSTLKEFIEPFAHEAKIKRIRF